MTVYYVQLFRHDKKVSIAAETGDLSMALRTADVLNECMQEIAVTMGFKYGVVKK